MSSIERVSTPDLHTHSLVLYPGRVGTTLSYPTTRVTCFARVRTVSGVRVSQSVHGRTRNPGRSYSGGRRLGVFGSGDGSSSTTETRYSVPVWLVGWGGRGTETFPPSFR